MAKSKGTVFYCQNCGYETPKWMGQCPGCGEWNTLVEETVVTKAGSKSGRSVRISDNKVSYLSSVETSETSRIKTGINELDRVLGGGIVRGSLVLVGGDPGIGKSTLLLQMCRNLCNMGLRILYISGEESLQQIKGRADRLGEFKNEMMLFCETNLALIEEAINKEKPQLVVVDSIQTIYREEVSSAPGSVSQVREATNGCLMLAKGMNIPIFLVGHVTKEGVVAGPRVLEHMVDTVLYFEGDRSATYRILRGVKNRFGSTNEIGVFEMESGGLVEVTNPSAYMLEGRKKDASGSIVACSIEGTRPVLMEVQALVCSTNFGMPRRTATGFDYNRLNLLMAVLEKKYSVHLSNYDAYLNIAGGMKVNEPAVDLAVVLAVYSSLRDISVKKDTVVFGEVGLNGEIRSVNMAAQRVQEARKLGFERCIMPAANYVKLRPEEKEGIECVGAEHVGIALSHL